MALADSVSLESLSPTISSETSELIKFMLLNLDSMRSSSMLADLRFLLTKLLGLETSGP